jgi:hypothetical protein
MISAPGSPARPPTTSGTAPVTSRRLREYKRARPSPDLCTMDARAIEFVFERRVAELAQRLVEVVGRPGQHRPDRLKRPHDERVKRAVASTHRRRRHWREPPGEHGRPPRTGRRDIPGTRRGSSKTASSAPWRSSPYRSLTRKSLLVPCGPPQQVAQIPAFAGRRSRPGSGGDPFEGGIDVVEGESWPRRKAPLRGHR